MSKIRCDFCGDDDQQADYLVVNVDAAICDCCAVLAIKQVIKNQPYPIFALRLINELSVIAIDNAEELKKTVEAETSA